MHADLHPQIQLALTMLFFGAIIAVFGLGARLSKKMGYRLPFRSKDDLPIMLSSIEFYLILVILPIAILAMLTLDTLQQGGPH